MSDFRGALHKMRVYFDRPVRYELHNDQGLLELQQHLGKRFRMVWHRRINCIHCGRETSKSFNQGYCYPCFRSLAQCDICIVSPEKCHFDQGTCREPEWAQQHCMQDHVVYLSNTSGVKVGITRMSQIPTRWIDQGAVQALAILKVSQRYHAGLIETAFKQYLNDKTNWRSMLKHEYHEEDLFKIFQTIWPQVRVQLDESLLASTEVIANPINNLSIEYPALSYPQKINSYNLDKTAEIEDSLIAIKGQYLIFAGGVINIRKYAGYQVDLEIG
jgi:hypothetical protein